MAIWIKPFTLDDLDTHDRNSAAAHLGIRFTGFGDDWLEATVPLDARTMAPEGGLHPGALTILAETVGSVAANLCIDASARRCLGQTISLNHPEPVTSGPVRARACPVVMLEHSQTWEIEMRDALGCRVCVSSLTVAVLERVPP